MHSMAKCDGNCRGQFAKRRLNVPVSWIQLCILACGFFGSESIAPERMEAMLAAGDDEWITAVFRRYPDEAMPFIDRYLEGGLKIIENGGSEKEANDSFRKGLKFAKLADKAFGETRFSDYAANFGSWSPEERSWFRKGQKAFRQGRGSKDDPAKALAHFEEALELAETLGDWWGMADAQGGVAQSRFALEQYEEARSAAMKAAEINARLRFRLKHIEARLVCAKCFKALGSPQAARGHLRIAWDQVRPRDDKKLRMEVLEAYCVALEASNADKKAAELREKFGLAPPSASGDGETKTSDDE